MSRPNSFCQELRFKFLRWADKCKDCFRAGLWISFQRRCHYLGCFQLNVREILTQTDPNSNRLLAQISPKSVSFLGYPWNHLEGLKSTRIRVLNQNISCGAWILGIVKSFPGCSDMQARFGADDVETHRHLPVPVPSALLCCLAQSRPFLHAEAGEGERP